jgi:hypothetical protein
MGVPGVKAFGHADAAPEIKGVTNSARGSIESYHDGRFDSGIVFWSGTRLATK